jgi:hypothetical protein
VAGTVKTCSTPVAPPPRRLDAPVCDKIRRRSFARA